MTTIGSSAPMMVVNNVWLESSSESAPCLRSQARIPRDGPANSKPLHHADQRRARQAKASGPQLSRVHDIRVCSGCQAEDLGKVAIDERQVDDGLLIDDSSQSGILRLNKRWLGTNRDLCLCSADCKLNLEPAYFGNSNLNTVQDEWLKSGRANC